MLDAIDIHPSHAIIQVNITLSNFEENRAVTIDLLNYEEDMNNQNLRPFRKKKYPSRPANQRDQLAG